MTTLTTAPGHELRDAFPLPDAGTPIIARAERRDRYQVHVTSGAEATLAALAPSVRDRSVGIVTDATVSELYGAELVAGLRSLGCEVTAHVVPSGEGSKSLDRAVDAWHWLAAGGLARRDVIVSHGGGVVADLGGWVASAYMRGLPYVNVPTTLLAQVDGALGGKVAVNHPTAKNLLGAFHQPIAVVSDVSALRSEDRRHLAAGLAECIKKAMIASPAYWRFIELRADRLLGHDLEALTTLVRAASAIKTSLIARDPYEQDLRRPLNFGHTIGHPLETVAGYGALLHGEAVAFGMVVESRVAAARGLMPPALLDDLVDLLRRCGLPTRAADLPARVSASQIVAAMEKVRLIRAGSLRYVLPMGLGRTLIADDVGERETRAALGRCGMA